MCIWLLPLHLHSHSSTYGLKSAPLLHALQKGPGLENLLFACNIVHISQNLGDRANHLLLLLG